MLKCTDERKCSSCFSDQGLCQVKKQQFIDGLNELSEKLGLKLVAQHESQPIKIVKVLDEDTGYIEVITNSDLIQQ